MYLKTKQQNKTNITAHKNQFSPPSFFCLNTKPPLQLHRHVPFLRAAGRRLRLRPRPRRRQEQFQGWQRRRGSRHGIGEESGPSDGSQEVRMFFMFFFSLLFWLVGWLVVGCYVVDVFFFGLPLMATFFSVKVCVFCWGEGHSKSSQVVLRNHFNTSRHDSIINI